MVWRADCGGCYLDGVSTCIVPVSHRPDLAPLVARWRVEAFFQSPGGYTVEQMTALILERPVGPKETFVLFEDSRPVGTAGLVRSDLKSRTDLTPWLAGLWVEPAAQRRGHATALVRAVEGFAASAGVSTLWLYTSKAEALYLRLGWQRAGIEQDEDGEVVLMRRELPAP